MPRELILHPQLLQISSFLADYGNALERADVFDAQVNADASTISADYAGIVALSIRQVFGATEITVSKNNDGSYNTSDVLVFMKGMPLYFVAWFFKTEVMSFVTDISSSDGVGQLQAHSKSVTY